MVSIRCEGKDGEKVRACIEQVAEALFLHVQEIQGDVPTILGPAPAPLERVNDRERWHLLVKGGERRVLHELVKKGCAALQSRTRGAGMRLIVDVDPYDML
jgi:primosomal protein N' (replication factor Y)